jgi:ribose transport system substrate-binding protein
MRKYDRLILIVFVLCLVVLSILPPGCKQRETDKPKIALIMKSLANEFFKTMEEGARSHHKEHTGEYDLTVVGIKDEEDVAKQIDLVELMIAQKVDAIVIAPADSKAMVPVCKRAMDAGITVVNIDNKFDAGVLADKDVKIPVVGPDNRKGARLAGEYLAGRLRPRDKVAIIEGVPNAFNGIQRTLGFEDAMKVGGMNIVSSQTAYWETAKANQVVSALVTEYADLKAVLCANDSMALGAVAAIKAVGKERFCAQSTSTRTSWRYTASSMPLRCLKERGHRRTGKPPLTLLQRKRFNDACEE